MDESAFAEPTESSFHACIWCDVYASCPLSDPSAEDTISFFHIFDLVLK